MSQTMHFVKQRLHHLPWLLAIAVLAGGLFTYSARTPEPETPPEPQAFQMDEDAFRKAMQGDNQESFPFALEHNASMWGGEQ